MTTRWIGSDAWTTSEPTPKLLGLVSFHWKKSPLFPYHILRKLSVKFFFKCKVCWLLGPFQGDQGRCHRISDVWPKGGVNGKRRGRRIFGVVWDVRGNWFVDFLEGNPGLVRRITFIQLVCMCLNKLVLEDAHSGKSVVLLTFCTCQFALACCQRHKTDVKSWHFMWWYSW